MKQTAPLEIGIPVIDLDRMLSFYTTVFGCQEVRRAEIPAELSEKIRVSAHGYTNVWLQFPGGEIVKLVRPPVPPERSAALDYAGSKTGIAYFTLYCENIAGAISAAEGAGANVISDRSLAETGVGVKLAFLRDPEGNVFEFVEQ